MNASAGPVVLALGWWWRAGAAWVCGHRSVAVLPVPYGYPLRADRYPVAPFLLLQQTAAAVPAGAWATRSGTRGLPAAPPIGYLRPLNRVPTDPLPHCWPALLPLDRVPEVLRTCISDRCAGWTGTAAAQCWRGVWGSVQQGGADAGQRLWTEALAAAMNGAGQRLESPKNPVLPRYKYLVR